MEITVHRTTLAPDFTISELHVDSKFQCYVLEDADRYLEAGGTKVYGRTAIPRGRYQVKTTWSPRFKKNLPLLLEVPQFLGVRIHPGNDVGDTEGCLLPGTSADTERGRVGASRVAFNALAELIRKAENAGEEVWITIS